MITFVPMKINHSSPHMKRFLFFAGLALLAAAACNKVPDKTPDYSRFAIAVEPVITRATETNFENGDAIGLTVTRATHVYAENAKLTFDGSAFKGDLTWYAEGGEVSSFAAYYPYAATRPTTFTVAADQSAGCASSDFISAVKDDVVPTPGEVTMVFKHRLARLVLDVTNNYGAAIDAFTVKGAIPTATIGNDLTATVDAAASPVDIKAWKNGDAWYVILPAQTVALTIAATAGSKTMEQTLATAELAAGKQYTAQVVVNPDDLRIVLSGEITNWDNGGELQPQQETQEVAFEEHLEDGYFSYDNIRYNVVKLADGKWWMAQPLAFLPAGKQPSNQPNDGNGVWYTYSSDGTNITPASDGANGYLYDIATVFGAPITADNAFTFEGAQGICPTGWHIPTRAEYFALVGNSNKAAGEASAPTDANAFYYDAIYGSGKIPLLDAAGFHYAFTGTIIKGSATATGTYNKLITSAADCSVEAYLGKPKMNYMLSSTAYSATQFFALMSTFTGTYKEGRLNITYSGIYNGTEVRCVRNAE